MELDLTAIGPRAIKEALVLRRLSEASGVPLATLAKRLAEMRHADQIGGRRELSGYIERKAARGLAKEERQQFAEELAQLYSYISHLEVLAGLSGQTAVLRDVEAERGTLQGLIFLPAAKALRIRAIVQAEDFADPPYRGLWQTLAPLVARVLLGEAPELYTRELAKRPGACQWAIDALRPPTLFDWLWPEYVARIRAARIKRERAIVLERLREALGDAELFDIHLRAAILRLEAIQPITAAEAWGTE